MTKPTQRRIITGHDAQGRAVVAADEHLPAAGMAEQTEPLDVTFFNVWATYEMPVDTSDAAAARQREGCYTNIVGSGSGTTLRVGVLGPGMRSPMHRTQSLDYAICLEGECAMELDSGEEVLMRAGDILVQRGTIHAWHNRSDRPCRMAWVLIDAQPVVVDGRPLPSEYLH